MAPAGGRGFSIVGDNITKTIGNVVYERSGRIDSGVAIFEADTKSIAPQFPATDAPAVNAALRQLAAKVMLLQAPVGYAAGDAELQARLKQTPITIEQYAGHGDSEMYAGDYESAIADYDHALTMKSDDANVLNGRCFVRAEANKDLDQALADCNASLALEPDDAAALDSRGFVYFRMGQLDQAIADYTAALKIDPDIAPSLYIRGLAERLKGDRKDADRDIAAAKLADPSIVKTYEKWGVAP
jgi:tetratricopeptide (TPR) repeat protein